jgi:uncharacterized membrane protein
MFNKFFIFFLGFIFFFSCLPSLSFAQSPPPPAPKQELFKAEVITIQATGVQYIDQTHKNPYQTVKVKILDGEQKNQEIVIDHGKTTTIRDHQKVAVGEKIVLLKLQTPKGDQYQIVDKYRLDTVFPLILLFFVLVLVLSRWKGLGAIFGLLVSIGVIVGFIVPQILNGYDPLLVSIGGSFFIMLTTIYLAHGFSRKTHIALAGTFISLALTGIFAYISIGFLKLSGLGTDDAFSLQFGQAALINLKGLLLGGIIIGALGVLDDITTSLSATIEEIKKANPKYTFWQLINSGLRVGAEHISSLVNTLVLAYAGVSLPLFLFIIINPMHQPLWAILNSEMIVEEIVRTLAGSIGLILAVPITTFLAAWIITKQKTINEKQKK